MKRCDEHAPPEENMQQRRGAPGAVLPRAGLFRPKGGEQVTLEIDRIYCGDCLDLDPFLGSGTTAIACLRTGRHYIGIEKHEPYFLKAQERIDKERQQVRLILDFEEATS